MKTLLAGAIDFGTIVSQPEVQKLNLKTLYTWGFRNSIGPIVNDIIPYVFVIAGLMLLFYLIAGGFRMMLGANDEKAIADGRAKITNALIGFLILFVSYWIVQIMQFILGFKVL